MSYENKDLYLRVKQNLVLLEMTRLKAVVQLNGKDVGLNSIIGVICNDLNQIQSNFTVPTEMLGDSPIYLNLSHEAVMVNGMLSPVPSTGDERYKHIPKTPDEMHDVIFKFPVFNNYIDVYNQNLKNESFFDRSRECAGNMITASSTAIRSIRKWAEGTEEAGLGLQQLLLVVNMVETIEWLFEFTNATSRRQILNDVNNSTGC